jgi:magnesium chelatase family protein
VLAANGILPFEALRGRAFLAELALDGRLRPVRGALAMALAARDAGCGEIVVCEVNGPEAALAPGIRTVVAGRLEAVLAHVHGSERLAEACAPERSGGGPSAPCLSEVRGQEVAKRALEIAAAGGHGLLLYGPPGAGKTMLARRLPGLLPPLDVREALEVTRILSAAGRLDGDRPLVCQRPFRAPHHTASPAGLLGGGNPPRPGEISLAHQGVLFMDEFPEFERRALASLRQVLEERQVSIARAGFSCVFPAHFQLIAASNPCPCGWYRSQQRDCRCDEAALARYRRRISGPLLDRIDLQVFVSAVPWRDLDSPAEGPTSAVMRGRVRFARARQERRGVACNAEITDGELERHVVLDAAGKELLGRAVDRLGLSARAASRILRVARTIADLAAEGSISPAAVAEALGYRSESIDAGG